MVEFNYLVTHANIIVGMQLSYYRFFPVQRQPGPILDYTLSRSQDLISNHSHHQREGVDAWYYSNKGQGKIYNPQCSFDCANLMVQLQCLSLWCCNFANAAHGIMLMVQLWWCNTNDTMLLVQLWRWNAYGPTLVVQLWWCTLSYVQELWTPPIHEDCCSYQ